MPVRREPRLIRYLLPPSTLTNASRTRTPAERSVTWKRITGLPAFSDEAVALKSVSTGRALRLCGADE
jgi:hypothetical protein